MAHSHPRHVRFASTIQQVIAPALIGIIPNGLVTVTDVTVTPDLTQARILYAVIGAQPEFVQAKLEELTAPLRYRLAQSLVTKRIPQIEFQHDTSSGYLDLPCTVS